MSTFTPYSVILDSVLPAPQCWPGIWRWWITPIFSSILISILPLSSILFCVSGIEAVNENGSLSDVLGDS